MWLERKLASVVGNEPKKIKFVGAIGGDKVSQFIMKLLKMAFPSSKNGDRG